MHAVHRASQPTARLHWSFGVSRRVCGVLSHLQLDEAAAEAIHEPDGDIVPGEAEQTDHLGWVEVGWGGVGVGSGWGGVRVWWVGECGVIWCGENT